MQTLAALLSQDFSSISSGQWIHQILLSAPLCSAAWGILGLTTSFVSVSQGLLSLCWLMISVLKSIVSNVLSGYLVVLGGNLSLLFHPGWKQKA